MPLPKVSVVQYLNTVPLIWGMLKGDEQGKFELSYTTPAGCADAALVIGDPALTYQGRAAHVYDLAAEWKRFTGLPFVFVLWVGHEDSRLSKLRKDFESSRDFGLAHVDEIAGEYGPKLKLAPEAVKVYLTRNIDYSLDEDNRKGLRLFYKLAREAGI